MKFKLTAFLTAMLFAPIVAIIPASAQSGSSNATLSAYSEAKADGSFKSDFFGMSLRAPSSWVLASGDEALKILNNGSEMVAGDDEEMKKKMDASTVASLPIFFLSKYAMSEGRSDNIYVSSIAENVAAFPFVKGGAEYFDNMKQLAANSATLINFGEEYETKYLGGVAFTKMSASISLPGATVKQDYYATRRGDHMISIVASYLSDDEKFMLDGIIGSIQFD